MTTEPPLSPSQLILSAARKAQEERADLFGVALAPIRHLPADDPSLLLARFFRLVEAPQIDTFGVRLHLFSLRSSLFEHVRKLRMQKLLENGTTAVVTTTND